MRGERVSDIQLAEEACHIEINVLGRPVGKQDHYASTFGGLNVFRFWASGQVTHDPLMLNLHQITELFSHFLLFWTNIQRDAAKVLTEQNDKTDDNDSALISMREQVGVMQKLLNTDYSIQDFGQMLHEGWLKKRSLATTISNPNIDVWYQSALDAGAFGGKLCGAGGGGFLLFIAPPEVHGEIRRRLHDLEEERISFEPHGVRTIVQVNRNEFQK